MRALVFGAGAVGGYLGAKLIQAGWAVTFLGRESTALALKEEGLRLIEDGSSYQLSDVDAIHQWPPPKDYSPDFILLTVKAYDCQQAADQLAQTAWRVPVASFINGVGSEDLLHQKLPGGFNVIAGTLTTAVEKPAAGLIKVTKLRGAGLQRSGNAADELAAALVRAGVQTQQYKDAVSMKWSKLLSNLIGNATTALTGLTVGQIYSHPELFRLELAALREATSVLQTLGHKIQNLPGVPIRWLAAAARLPAPLIRPVLRRAVAGGRGGKRPSMYYDVIKGRTEVDWLNGAVARSGERVGIPTPANGFLTEQVHQLRPGQRLAAEQLLQRAAAAGVQS